MKLRRLITLPLVLLVVLALAAALFTDLFGRQLIPGLPKLSLQRVERFQTSSISLAEVRSVAELTSVRLIHRAVFPYDYLPQGISITEVLRKLRTTTQSIAETLTDEELQYFTTFSLAREINLGTTADTFDFVVVSLVLSAGYSLEEGSQTIEVEEYMTGDGETARRALVSLGDPTILSASVEDVDAESYPYPDASISADGWRRIAEFVLAEGIPSEREASLLAHARERTERFVTTMLEQAGIDEVIFQ
jgi:hypothetical protein